uniref:Cytochrome P450 302a1, mitochondrial n=1 Tax=Timema cristinae TaxID=61476 RepID=A0A7R9CD45_TIMCR|nr:unnamed protein product [Timema cristinae]
MVGTQWKDTHYTLGFQGEYKMDRLHHNGFRKLRLFGPLVREELLPGINVVWVFTPEDIEQVFRAEGRYPERRSHLALAKCRRDRPHVYNTGGLLPTNGPEWLRLRSAFQRDLSRPNCVKTYLPAIDKVIQEFLNKITPGHNGNDFLPELSKLFLELICLVAFDVRLDSFNQKSELSSRLIDAALSINSSILRTDNGLQLWKWFDTPLYRKLKRSHLVLEQVAVELVTKKIEIMKLQNLNKTSHQPSLLELYLSSQHLDQKDVIGMSVDMILAGIDTTTNTSSFTLYHLATNLNIQEKLYEECLKLLPNCKSPITAEVLSKAQYTKAVLKESFRLNPISVGVGRILSQDAILSGYKVPHGTVVVTQNQVTCRLPEYFSEPDKFIPERWIKGHQMYKSTSPYLVLPFGHGPRTCIARRLAEQNMQALLLKRGTLSERERVSEKETDRDKEIIPHTQGCIDVAETNEIDGEVEEEGEAELISGHSKAHFRPLDQATMYPLHLALIVPEGCAGTRYTEAREQELLGIVLWGHELRTIHFHLIIRRFQVGWAGADIDAISLLINKPDKKEEKKDEMELEECQSQFYDNLAVMVDTGVVFSKE